MVNCNVSCMYHLPTRQQCEADLGILKGLGLESVKGLGLCLNRLLFVFFIGGLF